MHNRAIIWLSNCLYDHCIKEANQFYPLETGGTLMGYWYEPRAAVVTAVIDGGPNALHESYRFEPDQNWQLAEIALHYERSGRRETYLGDWHTHPDAATGRLSRTDRSVIRRIIKTPAARTENPMMLILHGGKYEWAATAWLSRLRRRSIIWPKLLVEQVPLRLYESAARKK